MDEFLKDPSHWQAEVYALTHIDPYPQPGVDNFTYQDSDSEMRSLVRLLDGAAVLLTFEAKGDVVATSLLKFEESHSTQKIFEFGFARNGLASDDPEASIMKEYIEEMITAMQKNADTDDIMNLVIDKCRGKIIARCRKLAATFGVSKDQHRLDRRNLAGLRLVNF